MKISAIMTPTVKFVRAADKIADAAKIMVENNLGAVPVLNNDDQLVGILTESDFIGRSEQVPHGLTIPMLLGEWLHGTSVEEIFGNVKDSEVSTVMSTDLQVALPNDSLTSAVSKMLKHNIGRLPVLDNGKLVGIITKRDVLKAVIQN